jgi:hypothetical protein
LNRPYWVQVVKGACGVNLKRWPPNFQVTLLVKISLYLTWVQYILYKSMKSLYIKGYRHF